MRFIGKKMLVAASTLALSFSTMQTASATTYYNVNIQTSWGTLVGSGHFNSSYAWIFNGNVSDTLCDSLNAAAQVGVVYTDGSVGPHPITYAGGCNHHAGVGLTQNPSPKKIAYVEFDLYGYDSYGNPVNIAQPDYETP